jgi:hypothetical protein
VLDQRDHATGHKPAAPDRRPRPRHFNDFDQPPPSRHLHPAPCPGGCNLVGPCAVPSIDDDLTRSPFTPPTIRSHAPFRHARKAVDSVRKPDPGLRSRHPFPGMHRLAPALPIPPSVRLTNVVPGPRYEANPSPAPTRRDDPSGRDASPRQSRREPRPGPAATRGSSGPRTPPGPPETPASGRARLCVDMRRPPPGNVPIPA